MLMTAYLSYDSTSAALHHCPARCQGPQEAVEWGAAHGILVQETPGDTTMVTQKQVETEVKRAKKGGGVTALR